MPDAAPSITAIDSHAHVFVRGLPLAPQRRHAPDYDATLADYLALLDAHEVSHAVLVQPSFLGTDNSFMLDAIRAQPKRLRGVAVIDADADDDQLHALAAGGIVGIRLNLIGLPIPDYTRDAWQHLLERVRALDWHVELHCEIRELERAGQAVLDAGRMQLQAAAFNRRSAPVPSPHPPSDGRAVSVPRAYVPHAQHPLTENLKTKLEDTIRA